jgi:predicted phosphodiesterase
MTVVYAVGDAATGTTDSQKLADMILRAQPDAFIYLGDVYEQGAAGEFAANYKPSWGQLDDRVWPIPGNHDWPNYATGYGPYFQTRIAGWTYYEAVVGGWTFLMCNSEEAMDPSSPQYQYFATKAVTGRKNIACWHRPRYCSGSHGDATDTDPLWELLAPHCPLILGGHAHNVQVFKPDATGCRQVVSGAGGRSLYAEIPDDPRLEYGEASGYAVARLDLDDTSVTLSFVDESAITLWSQQYNA